MGRILPFPRIRTWVENKRLSEYEKLLNDIQEVESILNDLRRQAKTEKKSLIRDLMIRQNLPKRST